MSGAYYNEFDPYAAQWLRNLIGANLIAPGDVDERSIADVHPFDTLGYDQCHFFAGIGGWPHALRLAGWPDDRPVWTGSCPCQPFSAAGKGEGFADERHLWPDFFRLIRQCRPPIVFGEQVASKPGLAWIDLVRSDVESSDYAFAVADLCAAGAGAPHIRQRLFWVADANRESRERGTGSVPGTETTVGGARLANGSVANRLADGGETIGMADDSIAGWGAQPIRNAGTDGRAQTESGRLRDAGGVGITAGSGRPRFRTEPAYGEPRQAGENLWSDLEWIQCSDGKARPTQPGLFPLAHGVPGRVGRLRAYGNAIVPQVAAEFIEAVMECRP